MFRDFYTAKTAHIYMQCIDANCLLTTGVFTGSWTNTKQTSTLNEANRTEIEPQSPSSEWLRGCHCWHGRLLNWVTTDCLGLQSEDYLSGGWHWDDRRASWLEAGQQLEEGGGGWMDAGANAASANASNQPPPTNPQYQLLALAVKDKKCIQLIPNHQQNPLLAALIALYVVMHSGQLMQRTQLTQQTNKQEKAGT